MIFWIFILLFFQHEQKKLTVLFLLLSGVIAVLAYAGGKQSNWLSDDQINFAKGNLSTDRGNKLEAQLRDAVVNGLTTRAQNHEKRLQAFAQSTGYPNLTPEQASFTDLLSTKHSNQLTTDMRNGLLTRLTYAVTNHEMRLRALEKPTALPTKVDGKCGTAAATCLAGTVKWDNGQTACGTTRTWHCEGNNGWATAYSCSFQNPACESYSCKGTYTWANNFDREWKRNYNVRCFVWTEENASACSGMPQTGLWWIVDPTSHSHRSHHCWLEQDDTTPGKPKYCYYECGKHPWLNIKMEDYCEKRYLIINCSSLNNESRCKAQNGCRWTKN